MIQGREPTVIAVPSRPRNGKPAVPGHPRTRAAARSVSTASIVAATARSTSSGVVEEPSEKRTELRASRAPRPIARRTWDGSGECVEQALPSLLERVLSELCGAYLVLDRDGGGRRTLAVEKSRTGIGAAERVEFSIGPGGTHLVGEAKPKAEITMFTRVRRTDARSAGARGSGPS